jgi:ankyrin repeat protein
MMTNGNKYENMDYSLKTNHDATIYALPDILLYNKFDQVKAEAKVKRFFDQNPDFRVDKDNIIYYDTNLLNKAVELGRIKAVKLLLEKGADVTVVDASGLRPLGVAVLSDKPNLEIIELLIKKNPGITKLVDPKTGQNPIELAKALQKNDLALAMEKAADPDLQDFTLLQPTKAVNNPVIERVTKLYEYVKSLVGY